MLCSQSLIDIFMSTLFPQDKSHSRCIRDSRQARQIKNVVMPTPGRFIKIIPHKSTIQNGMKSTHCSTVASRSHLHVCNLRYRSKICHISQILLHKWTGDGEIWHAHNMYHPAIPYTVDREMFMLRNFRVFGVSMKIF